LNTPFYVVRKKNVTCDSMAAVLSAAERAAVQLDSFEAEQLVTYIDLLTRWNERINLTALPLAGLPHRTLDRLLGEPFVASSLAPAEGRWFDLGSGGGSPAVPLKILRPGLRLTMVESRQKKAAFLREVVRRLGFSGVEVAARRFEELPQTEEPGSVDLLTARAIRLDDAFFATAAHLLALNGVLMLFSSAADALAEPKGYELSTRRRLPWNASLWFFRKI